MQIPRNFDLQSRVLIDKKSVEDALESPILDPEEIMQSSGSSIAQPEVILEWLQKEMGYRPQGPYLSSNKAMLPSVDSLRKICRGNMVPVWNFLLQRVKSEKTVEKIRRNILVHGSSDGSSDALRSSEDVRSKGRRKEKDKVKVGYVRGVGSEGSSDSREIALRERDLAEKEVESLRNVLQRQRKELRAKMLEVSREEAERKRMLSERSNYRKQGYINKKRPRSGIQRKQTKTWRRTRSPPKQKINFAFFPQTRV